MEIHVLRVSINEQDLNDLAEKHLPDDQPIEDLAFQVTSEGLVIKGVYPLFVNVAFETQWQLAARPGKLTARLAGFRAMGIPGNVFKSAILKMIVDSGKNQDWLQIDDDTIVVDVDRLLKKNGLTAQTNLTAVTCQPGRIVLESAAASK